MNDETSARNAGRDIALELMLKALFGALEHVEPKFTSKGFQTTLNTLVENLFKGRDQHVEIVEMRRSALEFIDDVLG